MGNDQSAMIASLRNEYIPPTVKPFKQTFGGQDEAAADANNAGTPPDPGIGDPSLRVQRRFFMRGSALGDIASTTQAGRHIKRSRAEED